MDGFSISKTIGQNNYEARYMHYNYDVQVEETKVEETKVEETKVEETKEEVEETKQEVEEEVEETKEEDSHSQIDFYFKDFNLQEKGKIQSNIPVEKNLLSVDNSKKKWIWRDV